MLDQRSRSHSASFARSCALACTALVLSAGSAAAVDLVGGTLARFQDKAGTRRDKMTVAFKNERDLVAPLPDPTRAASTLTLRYWPTGASQPTTVGPTTLVRSRWIEKFPGEYYLYKDRDLAAAGIQKIQLYSAYAGVGGGLSVKAKGDGYGAAAVSGPVDAVEVRIDVGASAYCGRFDASVSQTKRNDASRVHFVRGSGACSTGGGDPDPDPDVVRRVPAEWEEQEAVWLQWPGPYEKTYEPAYAEMSTVIAAYQKLHILYDSTRIRNDARAAIAAVGGDPDDANITWHAIANDNAWMRDNGPVYVVEDGQMRIQDWGFDAWGGAFGAGIPYAADDRVPVHVGDYLGMPVDAVDVVHERGNLEFNGSDAVILNWSVIGDPERNPGYTRAEAVADMKRYFGVTTVVLIEGWVPSDFTRGHVDGIARFISPDTVVVGQCTAASVCRPGDDEAAVYDNAAADIAAAGFNVIREPFEGRARYNGGDWFDIDYMNWLVGNGFVVAVGFENPATNAAAKARLETYYPGRDVYVIDMLASWDAGGGAHCHTNDQPAASTVAGYAPWTP